MSGHNKWSSIKHRKGAQDKKRSAIFTKIIKEISVAARMGGGDPDGNPRLRAGLILARNANMAKDTVERAIKKGTGELEGVEYTEATYEGFGPSGVALLVETLSDNTNRTVGDVRSTLTKRGGKMAEPGSVAWMFERHGLILVPKEVVDFERVFELALEAGAQDVEDIGEAWQVTTAMADLYTVSQALEGAGIACEAKLGQVATTSIEITAVDQARKVLNMIEALEENEDVQQVWGNFDFSDEVVAALAQDEA
jgi:YebC/PmpR family DNA-binding regulatory protein